jgi:PAS domain S-box-containing protein
MTNRATTVEGQSMTVEELQAENAELSRRLEEAEETIRAIQAGAVDAFVVEQDGGQQIYTLESADRPYRLLVEQMQQGAATLHPDGTIVYCNRRLAELLELPHEKLIGASLSDFFASEDRTIHDDLLRQGQRGSGRAEANLRRKDGELLPAFLTFNVLPGDCGGAIGVLVTDLTTEKHREQLTAAHQALRDADRRKDEFLATLAHELRNPLAPVMAALDAMKLSGDDPAVLRETRAMMQRQMKQMVRLIDDLLDVSRITRDKLELRRERVDLESIMHNAVEAARPLAQSLQHQMQISLPDGPVDLDADPARLTQVFGNLLNNACKFTPRGGKVSLDVRRLGGEVEVSVSDSGLGIAPDKLTEVFGMFAQVDRSLSGSQGGLGIGLTLARRLVEMHGGTVSAHSEGPGRGSKFIVRLPVLPGQPASRNLTEPAGESGPTTARRILVVDDNRDAAESLAKLLQFAGHETHTAHDGLEALTAAEKLRPDVVLLDIGLPKVNGFEVARKIREQSWGRSMTLIAVSGWGQDEDRKKSKDAGFDGHLVKPVGHAALKKMIGESAPPSHR